MFCVDAVEDPDYDYDINDEQNNFFHPDIIKTLVTIKSYSLEHPIKNLLILILDPKVQQEICPHQDLLVYYHHFQFNFTNSVK